MTHLSVTDQADQQLMQSSILRLVSGLIASSLLSVPTFSAEPDWLLWMLFYRGRIRRYVNIVFCANL